MNAQIKKIEFADGYKVWFEGVPLRIKWTKNGRGNSALLDSIAEVPSDSDAADFLRANRKRLQDYLWAPTGEQNEDTIIRAWNGVREFVLEAKQLTK